MKLPTPAPDAQAYSACLTRHIAEQIESNGGWIGFDYFMALALYAPGMGYYSGGASKFGASGDFITAPEMTPVFAQTIASQAAQILGLSAPHIIEVGAGSGRLAVDLLLELEHRKVPVGSYGILDLSGELRARQHATLAQYAPHWLERVYWLDRLPEQFDGLVLANELLDAMPVQLAVWGDDNDPAQILERGVAWQQGAFVWSDRPASGRMLERARLLAEEQSLPSGYLSEICLAAGDWTAAWADIMGKGALLLIDYGFPRHEYYHPQRAMGTLMCHYRHQAHGEPFFLPGLQDITAHVDFTAIAEAGYAAGLSVLGYSTQASFLLSCGLPDVLSRIPADDYAHYLPQAQTAQKLVSPAEMGELFKVIALGKNLHGEGTCSAGSPAASEADIQLIGFQYGDRSAML